MADQHMAVVGVAIEHHKDHHLLVASDIRFAFAAMQKALQDKQAS